MSALIQLKGIAKSFVTQEIETRALSQINLDIRQGEYLALCGPSGCGKSSLLSILGLLDNPTEGAYLLQGQDVAHFSRDRRAALRSTEIGFIFQSFNLISELNVTENVMLPLSYQSGISQRQMQQRAEVVLEKVGMGHRKRHFPSQLSGGQQQRVAVARALINQPSVILADEPTGNLDSKNAESVMALLDQLHQEGVTICMVTHDLAHAARAERKIDMFDGRIVQDHHLNVKLG